MEPKNINLIYEIWENKYIIGDINKNKITRKSYYFGDISNLEFSHHTNVFLLDERFTFFQKTFFKHLDRKLTLADIEKDINSIDIGKNILIGYDISDFSVNGNKEDTLLGKKWDISYTIGLFTLSSLEYNRILKIFGKNIKIKIYPNSLYLLKKLNKNLKDGNIVYFGKNEIEVINIINGFYVSVEKIPLGTDILVRKVKEIFGKDLINVDKIQDFHRKIYLKELNQYLEPVIFFLKENILEKWNMYVIGDFRFLPKLIETLASKLQKNIFPIKIDNKSFKNIEDANFYCIETSL